jgi:hypothetical protein
MSSVGGGGGGALYWAVTEYAIDRVMTIKFFTLFFMSGLRPKLIKIDIEKGRSHTQHCVSVYSGNHLVVSFIDLQLPAISRILSKILLKL